MNKLIPLLLPLIALSSFAEAAIVTFTGGTAISPDGTEIVTDANSYNSNIVSYQEGTVILNYVSPVDDYSFQTVGNYYGAGDDVIHGHWTAISAIEISRENNVPFDLQFFHMTSNTEIGGGAATGSEIVAIQGWLEGVAVTEEYMLPSDDWGGEYQDVFLPSSFDNVDKVVIRDLAQWETGEWVQADFSAFCYGMDNFVFDEVVPQELILGNGIELELAAAPELSSSLFGGLGCLLLLQRRRRY